MKKHSGFIKKITPRSRKLLSAPGNLLCRALGIPLRPTRIVFMTTDRCNSRCLHCNIWSRQAAASLLTPEEIGRVFSDRLFNKVRYVLCTGGEPTLRTDLEEVLLSLHRALPDATLQLSTNGILAGRVISAVAASMKNNINFEVGVSLDGIGEEHDRVRGIDGNFAKADRLIRDLIEIRRTNPGRLRIAVSTVISSLTEDAVYRVRDYARSLNIDSVEAWHNSSLFYGNDDKVKIEMPQNLKEIITSQPPTVLQARWLGWLSGSPIKFPCFALNTFCVIKANGDIVPCLNLWDSTIGSLKSSPPCGVWYGRKAREARRSIKRCRGCLNTWGAGWSLDDACYPAVWFYLKRAKCA